MATKELQELKGVVREEKGSTTPSTTQKILLRTALATGLLLTGCADWHTDNASDGGWTGTYKGRYIVVNESGGKVMDVWKVDNAFVKEVAGAGYTVLLPNGNVVRIGGDSKVIRINNDDGSWDKYHEFHKELSDKTYEELYPQPQQ